MRYSIGRDEKGMVSVTISTLSDNGASPTEAEDLMRQLLKEVNGKEFKLDTQINPVTVKKLNSIVVNYIKEKERAIVGLMDLKKYDYYALTLHALQKLRYVDESGNIVNQSRFANLFQIRRPTLNQYYCKVSVRNNKAYYEIERNLFLADFNI